MASCIDYWQTPLQRVAPGAIKDLKFLTAGYGKRYLVFTACNHVKDRVIADIKDSFEKTVAENAREFTNPMGARGDLKCTLPRQSIDDIKIEYDFVDLGKKEVTYENMQWVAEKIKAFNADCVVACGGGKGFDLVRGALFYIDPYFRPRCVIIPTQMASNACGTNSIVIYNEDQTEMLDIWSMKHYVDAVIIDSQLIADSPARLMAAGVGDALTCIEALYYMKAKGITEQVDAVALGHIKLIADVLMQNAVAGVEAVRNHTVTHELENLIEAVSFMSGPHFAYAGGYVQDIIDETLLEVEYCRTKLMHGERVGYGGLVQFMYGGDKNLLPRFIDMYRQIGLPCTFKELGIEGISYDEMLRICTAGCSKLIATMFDVKFKPEDIANAVFATEAYITDYLSRK